MSCCDGPDRPKEEKWRRSATRKRSSSRAESDEDAVSLGDAGDRVGHRDVARRSEETGVTEGEDAPVCCDEPIALPRRRGRHRDDRLVQGEATRGPEERGVTEGEDAAVTGDEPIAVARRC